MEKHFTLEYWTDEGWYVGKLREVPGVFSQGETLDELEANIREAYSLMLEDQQVPVPGSSVMQRDIVVEL